MINSLDQEFEAEIKPEPIRTEISCTTSLMSDEENEESIPSGEDNDHPTFQRQHLVKLESHSAKGDHPLPSRMTDLVDQKLQLQQAFDFMTDDKEDDNDDSKKGADGRKAHLYIPSQKTLDSTALKPQRSPQHLFTASDLAVQGKTVSSLRTEDIVYDNEGNLPFYFVDAAEENNLPGTAFLFGKIMIRSFVVGHEVISFANCCLKVEGIQLQLYLCPRIASEKSESIPNLKDALTVAREEFEATTKLQNASFEEVTRGFFIITDDEDDEDDDRDLKDSSLISSASDDIKQRVDRILARRRIIPHREDLPVLSIRCPFSKDNSRIPKRGESFRLFGLTSTALERLLIERRLMGPSWLLIRNNNKKPLLDSRGHCWTGIELSCRIDQVDSMPNQLPSFSSTLIEPLLNGPSPPLTVLSLNMQTMFSADEKSNQVVVVSGLVHKKVYTEATSNDWEQQLETFTIIRKISPQQPWPTGFELEIKSNSPLNRPILCDTEEMLLNQLLLRISETDCDVITGHNFIGFDLDILLHRMQDLKIRNWSKLGRMKREKMPTLQQGPGGLRDSTWEEKKVTGGRLICDTYISSKQMPLRLDTYSLAELSKKLLNIDIGEEKAEQEEEEEEVDDDDGGGGREREAEKSQKKNKTREIQRPAFGVNAQDFRDCVHLLRIIRNNERNAFLALKIMFTLEILPLTKQLTQLSGNLWSRSLTGGKAERIEYLLLHEFFHRNLVLPDKKRSEKKNSRAKGKKKTYEGGYVIEPQRGLYESYVLLLDFNSLYPSLIQEYDICFTTIPRCIDPQFIETRLLTSAPTSTDNDSAINSGTMGKVSKWKIAEPPCVQKNKALLPFVIETLVKRRKDVKRLQASESDPIRRKLLETRQLALKLTANSMYGCLGFPMSRFYAPHLADLITRKGREALQLSQELTEKNLNLKVIYGDTDSIMVFTGTNDLKEAEAKAKLIESAINSRFKLLEIEHEATFKTILLLRKKKYAAVVVDTTSSTGFRRETKGLDLVRRDWCPLSKEVGVGVLDFLLGGERSTDALDSDDIVRKIHQYLERVRDQLDNQQIPLYKFAITKGLSKTPEEYPESSSLPHVQVALHMLKKGISVRQGQRIPYIICKTVRSRNQSESSSSSSFTATSHLAEDGVAFRAYHPDEVKDMNLQIDIEWYKTQQLHAPVMRLLSCVNSTNVRRIAECLGIDASRYQYIDSSSSGSASASEDSSEGKDKFSDCEVLKVICPYCKQILSYLGSLKAVDAISISENQENHSVQNAEMLLEYGSPSHALQCSKCQREVKKKILENATRQFIRAKINQFYQGWYVCDERPHHRAKLLISKENTRCPFKLQIGVSCKGLMKEEYNSKKLHTQLLYLKSVFEKETAAQKIVDEFLKKNQRQFVDCKKLFSMFERPPQKGQ